MVILITESGKMINDMAMEYLNGQMVTNIKVHGKTIKDMDKEYILSMMVDK